MLQIVVEKLLTTFFSSKINKWLLKRVNWNRILWFSAGLFRAESTMKKTKFFLLVSRFHLRFSSKAVVAISSLIFLFCMSIDLWENITAVTKSQKCLFKLLFSVVREYHFSNKNQTVLSFFVNQFEVIKMYFNINLDMHTIEKTFVLTAAWLQSII